MWGGGASRARAGRGWLALATRVLAVLALAAPLAAEAADTLFVRFVPSVDDARVSHYRLYYGIESGKYTGSVGLEAGETLNTGLRVLPFHIGQPLRNPLYLAMTAVGRDGIESARSNEVVVDPLRLREHTVISQSSFESLGPGRDPGGLGGPQPSVSTVLLDGQVSLAVGASASQPVEYELLRVPASLGDWSVIGRFRSDGKNWISVALSAVGSDRRFQLWIGPGEGGTSVLLATPASSFTCQPPATLPVLETGRWYYFSFSADHVDVAGQPAASASGNRRRMRSKVWLGGAALPSTWNLECVERVATPALPMRLMLGAFAGQVFFDDIALLRLASTTPTPPAGAGSAGSPGGGSGPPQQPQPEPQPEPEAEPEVEPEPQSQPGYRAAASLVHWWRPGFGFAAADWGADYGRGAPLSLARVHVAAAQLEARGTRSAGAVLNGVNRWLSHEQPSTLGIADHWTLATWVRVDGGLGSAAAQTLFHADAATTSGPGVSRVRLLIDSQDRFAVEVSDDRGITRRVTDPLALDPAGLRTDVFHVAARKEAGTLALYVNGEEVARSTGVPAQTNALRSVRVGASWSPLDPFAGAIYSTAIWSRALAPEELAALFRSGDRTRDLDRDDVLLPGAFDPAGYLGPERLRHLWHPGLQLSDLGGDFGNGSPSIDLGRDAVAIAAADVVSGWTSEAYVDLDGTREALANLAPSFYGIEDHWTLALWLRPDAGLNGAWAQHIFDLAAAASEAAGQRVRIAIEPDTRLSVEVRGSGPTARLTDVAPLDVAARGLRWYHVAVVKEGSQRLTLYVDGQVVATRSQAVPTQRDVTRVLSIGAPYEPTGARRHFNGALGSIALWDRALGQAEVESIYSAGDRRRSPLIAD